MPKATLYLGRLTAVHTSPESNKDDVFMEVWEVDAQNNHKAKLARWPNNNATIAMGDGGSAYMDLALNVDYDARVQILVRERDASSNDDASSTILLAQYYLDRRSATSATLRDTTGPKKTCYDLSYRIIKNPIPTVCVLGIKCEKQTDDIDGGLASNIAEAASTCAEEAAKIIGKSPRPRAKAISEGLKVASTVLEGVEHFIDWLAHIVEGKDDVYMVHYTSSMASADIDGRFFPKQNEEKVWHMGAGDTVYFEEKYGEYFRFPIDQEDVTIEFREHDAVGKDISICTVRIPRVTSDADPRLGGGAIEAVGDTYAIRGDGKSGVYHMVYSICMEDWALTGSADVQGAPPDAPTYPATSDKWSPATCLDAVPMGSSPFVCRKGNDLVLFAHMPSAAVTEEGLSVGTSPVIYTPKYCVLTSGGGVEWLPVVPDAQAGLGSVPTTRPAAAIWSSGTMVVLSVWDVGVVRQYNYQAGKWSLVRVPSRYPTIYSPGVASPGEPRLDIFTMAQGDNGVDLLRGIYESSSTPENWELVNCHGIYAPAAVTSWPRIDLVHVDDDNVLCHHVWDGDRWTKTLAGGATINSAPALASRGPGRLDCVARGPWNQLLHRVFENGAWGPWYEVTGPIFQGDPAIVVNAAGGLDVVVRGLDGTPWKTSLQP